MKTYKEQDRSSTTMTVILDPLIRNQEDSTLLKSLSERTDIFFVFSKAWMKNKKPPKFSKLYGATYYGTQEGSESEVNLIWTVLDYGREFGNGYLGYFVVLGELSQDILDPVANLGGSLIETSVWSTEELGWEYLKSIYEDQRGKIKRIIEDLAFGPLKDLYHSYESDTTKDSVIFLREITLVRLEDYFRENELYRRTFDYSDFGTFISSVSNRVCPETRINVEIKNAKT